MRSLRVGREELSEKPVRGSGAHPDKKRKWRKQGKMSSTIGIIALYAVIIGAFYFIAIRPNKKREKEHAALVNAVEVGDSVLTTSGFYGVVIDIPSDDVIIVEFGSNKNCRIPMQKSAIVEVEKEGEED